MKIISLNTWGGLAGKDLMLSFFKKYKDEADVFCLQEIWAGSYRELDGQVVGGRNLEHDKIMINGKEEISEVLPDHTAYFRPHFMEHYGLLSFVRKNLEVVEEGEIFVHKEKGYIPEGDVGGHARNIQHIKINTKSGPITVINFHGLWNGKGKTDSEERLIQSDKIASFINKVSNPVVFCGDFNLLPETESIKRFENIGLRNLIKENGITSTRTSFYTKPVRYADYMFVSEGIKINKFKIMQEEVSDHNPMLLDID